MTLLRSEDIRRLFFQTSFDVILIRDYIHEPGPGTFILSESQIFPFYRQIEKAIKDFLGSDS